MSKPTLEQMQEDADFLVKFRGYCRKVKLTIIDMPNNNAYSTLSGIMYAREQDVSKSKQAINYLWGEARHIEVWIAENDGPKLCCLPPMKTWKETEQTPWVQFKFSVPQQKQLANILIHTPDDETILFIRMVEESINEYLFARSVSYPDNPSRGRAKEDDQAKLETLLDQTNRVISHLGQLAEMQLGRYRNADWGLIGSASEANGEVWNLYSATKDAIERIKASPRRHKPLEYELAASLAYHFWKSTRIKPTTKDSSPFMHVMDIVEQAIDSPKDNRALGIDLMKESIKSLNLPKRTP